MSERDTQAEGNPAKTSGADLSRVRAVFFDLDDTLCAYWEASKFGMRQAFEKHGPAGFTVDELIRAWAAAFREFSPTIKRTEWYDGYLKSGEPTRTEQMRLTLLRLGIVDEELALRLSESYMVERNRALTLFDDAEFVLERLRTRYPLGLITNGPADIQRQEIETLGIEHFFQNIFIEGEMGEGKPLPSVFARAAEAVGFEPEQILFVGNSFKHDVSPAIACNWRAVWVRRMTDVPPSTGQTDERLEEAPAGAPPPDAIIGELSELIPLLKL
jgi:putative hydrolase of the HAD superfamily